MTLALHPATESRTRESLLMNTRYFFVILALSALAFAGCSSDKTETTQTQTDQTTKRVHTQAELRKTGESQTGPALEKVDPSVRTNH